MGNSTTSTDKMNPLSPSALIATLMCAFAVTEGASTAQTKNVHRYWKSPKDHFYTTDITGIGVTNIGMTGKWGYKYESVPFSVLTNQAPGTTALKTYWNPEATDHFYTTDCGQGDSFYDALPTGYEPRGKLGYCYCEPTKGTLPLQRFYNKEFNVMCRQPSFNPLNHNHYAHHQDPVIILRGV